MIFTIGHFEDQCLDGRMMKMRQGVVWDQVAQNWELRFGEQLVASQERSCSMASVSQLVNFLFVCSFVIYFSQLVVGWLASWKKDDKKKTRKK